jgi:uncharacterized protein YgiM (DUF1202 family)
MHTSFLVLYNEGSVPVTAIPVPATPHITALSAANLRSGPGVEFAIVGWLDYNETASIAGRNANSTWLQVQTASGVTGWVEVSLVALGPGTSLDQVPVVEVTAATQPSPAASGPAPVTVTPVVDLNVRGGPGVQYDVVGWLRVGQAAQAVGRNQDGSWLKILHENRYGWVNATYTTLQPEAEIAYLPLVP